MNVGRTACFAAAAVTLGAAAIAHASVEPCGKNHYILSEPCALPWTAINEGLSVLEVRVLAVDPMHQSTLYAGGPNGVYKSLDGGAHWNMTGLEMAPLNATETAAAVQRFPDLSRGFAANSVVAHLAIDPGNPRVVYAGTKATTGAWYGQHRVFKSIDGGETWTDSVSPRINGVDNIHGLLIAPSNPDALYLANYDDGTGDSWSPLVRSMDGAATWTYLGLPAVNVLTVDPIDSLTLYAGTFEYPPDYTDLPNGVLKSIDGGASWAATGLIGLGITALTVDPKSSRTLYAAAGRSGPGYPRFDGLFKSIDGGETWVALHATSIAASSAVTVVVVDPRDSNKVYVTTAGSGISRSIDGGATWAAFNDGLQSLAVYSLVVVAGSPSTLYAGTSAGVFRITEYGGSVSAREFK